MSKNITPNVDRDGTTIGTPAKIWSGVYVENILDSANGRLSANKNYVDRKINELKLATIPLDKGYRATNWQLSQYKNPVNGILELTNGTNIPNYIESSLYGDINPTITVKYRPDAPINVLKECIVYFEVNNADVVINWEEIIWKEGSTPVFGTAGKWLIVKMIFAYGRAFAEVIFNSEV